MSIFTENIFCLYLFASPGRVEWPIDEPLMTFHDYEYNSNVSDVIIRVFLLLLIMYWATCHNRSKAIYKIKKNAGNCLFKENLFIIWNIIVLSLKKWFVSTRHIDWPFNGLSDFLEIRFSIFWYQIETTIVNCKNNHYKKLYNFYSPLHWSPMFAILAT